MARGGVISMAVLALLGLLVDGVAWRASAASAGSVEFGGGGGRECKTADCLDGLNDEEEAAAAGTSIQAGSPAVDGPAYYCLVGTTNILNAWADVPAQAETPNVLSRRLDDGRVVVSHMLTSLSLEMQPGYESVLTLSAEYDYNNFKPRVTQLSSYIYHANLSSWFQIPHGSPEPARHGFSLAYAAEQHSVILFGGFRNDPFVSANDIGLQGDVWILDLERARWRLQNTTLAPSSFGATLPRAGHSATVLHNNANNSTFMVIFGGFTQTSLATEDMLVLDLSSWTWTHIKPSPKRPWPGPRFLQNAMLSNDNTMLMFGSRDNESRVTLDLWEFNLTAESWVERPKLNWSELQAADCDNQFYESFFSPNIALYHTSLNTLFAFPFKYGSPWLQEFQWTPMDYGSSPCVCQYNRSEGNPRWKCGRTSSTIPLDGNFRWLSGASGRYGIYHFAFSYDMLIPTEWLFNSTPNANGEMQSKLSQLPVSSLSVPNHRILSTANYHHRSQSILLYGGMKLMDKLPFNIHTDSYDTDLASNDLWIYQRDRQSWSRLRLNNTPPSRYAHASTIAQDSVLLVFSGFHAFTMSQRNTVWCFDLDGLNWYPGPAVDRTLHDTLWRGYSVISYLSRTNELIVHGGYSPSSLFTYTHPYNDTWALEFDEQSANDTLCSGTWKNLHCRNTPRLLGHTAVTYDDTMIVFGGATFNGFFSSYDLQPQNDTWRLVRPVDNEDCYWERIETTRSLTPQTQRRFVQARLWHTSVLIGSQMVVSGGCVPFGPCSDLTRPLDCCMDSRINMDHAWVLDLVTFQWTYITMRSEGLFFTGMHTAVAIGNYVHILDGLRDGGVVSPDQNLRSALVRHDYKAQLASPLGIKTASFANANWTSCPENSYSDQVGSAKCSPCPDKTHSSHMGSGSLQSCRYCSSETVCHGHGTCVVNQYFQPICNCDAGYLSTDNCALPLMYFYCGAGGLFVLLVMLCIILCQLYKTRRKQESVTERRLQRSRSVVAQLNSAWQIDILELSLTERLDGETPGAFGEVWKASYRDMPVAVKKLKSVIDHRSRKEFEREVSVMKTIRHPNIVLFLGAGLHDQQPFLVVELMSRGALSTLLRNKSIPVEKDQQLRWALDIAKGIRYLHGLLPPRIHRDLKTSNILLSERWAAKVADFGTARLINDIGSLSPVAPLESDDFEDLSARLMQVSEGSRLLDVEGAELLNSTNSRAGLMTRDAGTLLWCSPEVLAGKPYGGSTDVYSFGIILWELLSRQIPFSEFPDFKWMSKISDGVEAGRRPTIPQDCHPAMSHLIQACWSGEPEARPTFKDIVPRLDDILEQAG